MGLRNQEFIELENTSIEVIKMFRGDREFCSTQVNSLLTQIREARTAYCTSTVIPKRLAGIFVETIMFLSGNTGSIQFQNAEILESIYLAISDCIHTFKEEKE